jgi:3-hydroxyacyl-[acyl-carrier-protein] dehydratase
MTAHDNTKNDEKKTIDIQGIMERIPHRYPMLMIDKVIDVVAGESATGVKNVTVNEPFFQGHFPKHPIMPGVLIVEAMAQTSAVLVVDMLEHIEEGRHMVYFMTIDEARFRRPVFPGDVLHIKVKKERQRGSVWKFRGEAFVGDEKAAEATYSAMLVDTKREPALSPENR